MSGFRHDCGMAKALLKAYLEAIARRETLGSAACSESQGIDSRIVWDIRGISPGTASRVRDRDEFYGVRHPGSDSSV